MKAKLTQKGLETLADGVYQDAPTKGLYLVIKREGKSRAWVLRRQVNGKRHDVGLGSASSIPLAAARALAGQLVSLPPDDFLAEVKKRQSAPAPVAQRKTYRQVYEEFVAWNTELGNYAEWTQRGIESRSRIHILPAIGSIPIDDLQPADVAKIAESVWEKPDIAKRCLEIIRAVFNWAKAKGYTKHDNPADRSGALKYLLPTKKHVKQNHGALSVEDLPLFFAASMAEKQTTGRQCLEFSILTATRSLTARSARWDQIDLEAGTWTIPPDQLKVSSNGGLIVPLAPKVVDFLQGITRERDGYVFPGRHGQLLWDAGVSRFIKETPGNWIDKAETEKRGEEVKATQHGIARATFMTWSQDDSLGNDKRFDVRVAHLCLHHKLDDGYNGAYERQTMFLRRRELMTAWADYCFSKVKTDGESK